MTTRITAFFVHDVRFPTDVYGDGTDAMNKSCDHSLAYIQIITNSNLRGQGCTFSIGRGNDIMCYAIDQIANRILGMDVEDIFSDMGAFWEFIISGDSQHRWLGPEKGVIHMASAAVINAVWDMFAKSRGKPLWQLIADFSPEELVNAMSWRYITDTLTREEALEMLKRKEHTKRERILEVTGKGYPAYTTSAGWFGYSDEKVDRLVRQALRSGFNHIKLKVGVDKEDDLRRCKLIRSIIDDPANMPEGFHVDPRSIVGKNAGPTGCVLMLDANQSWDVSSAIDHVSYLASQKPWFIEEPSAPDDVLAHLKIKKALAPLGIKVATGEHTHNRMAFKNFFELGAMDVCQLDAVRLGGFNEVLTVLLLAEKFGIPVCPHSGAVGLMNYHVHVSLIDFICVSGNMEQNVLEYVDHHFVHDVFTHPVGPVNSSGRYKVPIDSTCGSSIELLEESLAEYSFPNGRYWIKTKANGNGVANSNGYVKSQSNRHVAGDLNGHVNGCTNGH